KLLVKPRPPAERTNDLTSHAVLTRAARQRSAAAYKRVKQQPASKSRLWPPLSHSIERYCRRRSRTRRNILHNSPGRDPEVQLR
ncbi:hypothetical protein LSAT2_015133, partial [Lamellibrachia satsuma]